MSYELVGDLSILSILRLVLTIVDDAWDDVEESESSSDDAMDCVVDNEGTGADNFVSTCKVHTKKWQLKHCD